MFFQKVCEVCLDGLIAQPVPNSDLNRKTRRIPRDMLLFESAREKGRCNLTTLVEGVDNKSKHVDEMQRDPFSAPSKTKRERCFLMLLVGAF